jgi:hypothetical protein
LFNRNFLKTSEGKQVGRAKRQAGWQTRQGKRIFPKVSVFFSLKSNLRRVWQNAAFLLFSISAVSI